MAVGYVMCFQRNQVIKSGCFGRCLLMLFNLISWTYKGKVLTDITYCNKRRNNLWAWHIKSNKTCSKQTSNCSLIMYVLIKDLRDKVHVLSDQRLIISFLSFPDTLFSFVKPTVLLKRNKYNYSFESWHYRITINIIRKFCFVSFVF